MIRLQSCEENLSHFDDNVFLFPFLSNDVDMETEHYSNGVAETSSNGFLNGSSKHDHEMEECDTEMGLQ